MGAICRRLDCLPLAIELAAALARRPERDVNLDPLGPWINLLTEGPIDLPPRQQSLRAAIARSVDLLDRREQTVFRRLAVFRGGCTLEAAESVCARGAETFDAVELLAEWRLLRRTNHGGEARYEMLETVREYAHERLVESGELATTQLANPITRTRA